jgi:lysine-N-methylase
MGKSVPLAVVDLREQRYSCHGCGDCCRDFSVQLREEDLDRLRDQRWEERLGERVTVEFRGQRYLRQRPDGACLFLQDDGRCRIHAEFGFDQKPVACRLFPFNLAPDAKGVRAGLNFACSSVRGNRGAALTTHRRDLERALREVPEAAATLPPRLDRDRRADAAEVEGVVDGLDAWLRREDVPLPIRLDGFAWLAHSLGTASFTKVRGSRVRELAGLLASALPAELEHLPVAPPARGHWRMLRQASFARIEDPRFTGDERRPSLRARLSQWNRSRRFARGRGAVPSLARGWRVPADFAAIESMPPPGEDAGIADLVIRWLRATIRGGRAWGAGYYGWPVTDGLQALALDAACLGWLARAHAAGERKPATDLPSVAEALGRIDRARGRAVWLGSAGERLRLRYFAADDGLRRLVRANW